MNAAAILLLAEKGLSALEIAEVAAALEVRRDPTAADRMARMRERKRNSVTRNVTANEGSNERDNLTSREEIPQEAKASLPREPKSERAHRLPDGWEPKPLIGKTLEMVTAWPAGMIERELAKFKDHWLKTPGARGRSLDWDASYRNWLRNAEERRPRQHERSNANPTADAVNRILGNC